VDQTRAKLDGELAAKIAAAENTIQTARSKALASLTELASDIAADIVNQLIGAKVTKADAAKAVAKAQGN
jgi:F-type H+-transporting ATPase subunit b